MKLRKVSRDAIGHFLYSVPDFKKRLRGYHAKGNHEIKEKIGELLTDDCALAREFHQKRTV
ncbi:MAG: hypothetical protein JW932_15910 [Deltaproteobacteria bacterium]|nr:hypothetical protein [Deltaproteobacteria bacterium]